MGLPETAGTSISATPERVFRLVADPSKLPSWNSAIVEVTEGPACLDLGSVWKVRIRALGRSWISKSQVTTLDPASGHFAYRSQSDNGNPSYADWDWQIEPDNDGSRVTVGVDLNPTTFWRKHFLVHLRRPALRKEIAESLESLRAAAESR
jgi:uncharacterized protein YndB with AHSA1/START domain